MQKSEYDRMDRLETSMWWYRGLHRLLVQTIARAAARKGQTGGQAGPGLGLDAGCGTGGLLKALARSPQNLRWFGLEIDPEAARRAQAKSGWAVSAGSIEALPYGEDTFDVAVSADVLSHARVTPARALGELHRVLKPGGLLVLNLPAYPWLLSRHDRAVHNARRFTAGAVRADLAAAGFAIRRSSHWNTLLFPLMLTRRLLPTRDNAKSDVAAYPAVLDATFSAALALERVWLGAGIGLPFGGSLLVVAQKK